MVPARTETLHGLRSFQRRKFKKNQLIFNPQSGRGMALPFLSYKSLGIKRSLPSQCQTPELFMKLIEHHLREYDMDADIAVTSSSEQATAIARRCADSKYDLVIAVGGDGTVNAVVNGIIGSDTALAVIPSGTVNVLGLQLDLPTDLQESVRRIRLGETACIDVGRVDHRYFTCMAGVGFDAYVIKSTRSAWKKMVGVLAYGVVALDSLFTFPFKTIHFRIDDQAELKKGYFVVVGNVKYYASNLMLLPQANPADGFLDVAIFKKKNLWRYAGRLVGIGRNQPWMDVEHLRCKAITFPEGRHLIQLDGDYYGRTPVTIRVVPCALRVVL